MVQRDVTLAGLTRGRVHIAHMSTRGALRAVREGKSQGFPVTCEVAPHHFTLTDAALESPVQYDTNCKMNPPLREPADVEAMIEGIVDGSVDAIATDHAPHHADEKGIEFDQAPFGIVGLETCVPLVFEQLVHSGRITLGRAIELLSTNPAGFSVGLVGRLRRAPSLTSRCSRLTSLSLSLRRSWRPVRRTLPSTDGRSAAPP